MPVVGIPALLRDLTGGQRTLVVEGETVRQVIENLEARYPGIKPRLCDGERLQPAISVVVDGQTSYLKLRQPLRETSEVHFVLTISGGARLLVQPARKGATAAVDRGGDHLWPAAAGIPAARSTWLRGLPGSRDRRRRRARP
jgi:molybdopterin synthase sulfur carrier subunit